MEGSEQNADGDGDIQIGGDGVVAKDVSGSIVAGGDVNISVADHKELAKEIMSHLSDLGLGPQSKLEDTALSPEEEEGLRTTFEIFLERHRLTGTCWEAHLRSIPILELQEHMFETDRSASLESGADDMGESLSPSSQ